MRAQVWRALDEDFQDLNDASGRVNDLSTGEDSNPGNPPIQAELICQERGVLAGAAWFAEALFATERRLQRQHGTDGLANDKTNKTNAVTIDWRCRDGDPVCAQDTLCVINGDARVILAAERTALNFIQTLSGTATTTAAFVARAKPATIRDTRKTLPNLRHAQKYAVRCGGGANHRFGLYDAILIKDNHIAACGSVTEAITRARRRNPDDQPIEVEADTPNQAHEALVAGVECILLDNFTIAALREIVAEIKATNNRVKTEASGNITLDNVAAVAATGVDYIAIGALTKHLRAIDMSLRVTG